MSKSDVRITGEYFGLPFHIDRFWKFCVPDLDKNFTDYESMKSAIERDMKRVKAAKNRKVSIEAIDNSGKKVTVTGVHAGHGHLITSPKRDRYDCGELYVSTKLVVEAMKERSRLEYDISAVKGLLDAHRLDHRGYRSFDMSMHEGELRRLEKVVEKSNGLASLPLQEALSKVPRRNKLEL